MTDVRVDPPLVRRITDRLTRLKDFTLETGISSTGEPQGALLFPCPVCPVHVRTHAGASQMQL